MTSLRNHSDLYSNINSADDVYAYSQLEQDMAELDDVPSRREARSEAIRRVLRDWLRRNGYPRAADLPTTIRNERVKLLSGFLNGAGVAALAVGGFGLMVALPYEPSDARGFLIVVSGAYLFAGCVLHAGASLNLRRLKS